MSDRLLMADGEVAFNRAVIRNLHEQLEQERETLWKVEFLLEKFSKMMYEGYVPPEDGAARQYYKEGVQDCAEKLREVLNQADRSE